MEPIGVPSSGKQIPPNRRVKKIVHYIEGHLHESIRVREVAERSGISISTIEHYFAAYYHTGFHVFVEKLKMEKAFQLISKEGMMVKQAMYATGYKNRATFNNAFKKWFKHPPSYFGK